MIKRINCLALVTSLCLLASCSNSSTNETASDELTDASSSADFIVDSEGDKLDNIVSESDQAAATEPVATEQTPTETVEEVTAAEQTPPADQNPVTEVAAATAIVELGQYTIEKNDTFMLIAFKIYGDYSKWKELAEMNPEQQGDKLNAGEVIKFNPPAEKFVWSPQGNPYLIKKGDTLGVISKDVYGIDKRWKEIFDNNKPMIKDPNLIFAGFTLYYIPDRNVASETY